ncbi:MAG: lipid A deacylase LpxR family protein [Gammaproteobacteria bacterium]|nr:lipid A deacylase LpxR family protein [Gammaproteobacteria bacterium]
MFKTLRALGIIQLGLAMSVTALANDHLSGGAVAAAPFTSSDHYFSFYLDNDLFANSDENYTNGIRFSLISGERSLINLAPFHDQLERMAAWAGDEDTVSRWSGFEPGNVADKDLQLNYGLSLTQLMFTPEDPYASSQPPGQRRYAGWLGLGFSVHASDDRALNSAELILGTIGPRSLAQQAQDQVHDIRGIPRFEGWDNQVPNEFTLDLALAQKRRVRLVGQRSNSFTVDGFTEGMLRLGTFRTGARVGGLFRAGFHLPPDFSDPRLDAIAYSHRLFKSGIASRALPDWSLYALLGANLGAVLFDATLDGPLFKNFETGNTREPWVAESYLGFGFRWRTFEFSYVHTWRTKEFEEQSQSTEFGSLAILFRFEFDH